MSGSCSESEWISSASDIVGKLARVRLAFAVVNAVDPVGAIGAVIMAAGAGRRFGGEIKQLHAHEGRPMLETVLRTMAATGIEDRVVVLGAHADAVMERADLHGARPVVCPRWADGQAASLRCGLGELPAGVEAALIVLGDGPGLDPRAVERIAAADLGDPPHAVAADYGAGRSHPVLIPRALWSELPAAGETPGRALPTRLVDCRDLASPGDVDYPQSRQ
jgi:CTP:molybdopterin cytidylyltransferase MocA